MSTFIKLLSILVIAAMPMPLSAMTVAIEPGSLQSNKQADMNLSGLIVRKVQWEDGALMMPVTVSNDRSYHDVKLISRDLYLKMEDCFINGCREASPNDNPTLPLVKVEAIKKLNSKFRVTNIEISFDNAITVSVGIMAENYPNGTYWLSYPQSIDFSSPLLKEQTDNVVFGAYAAENPHLTVERASPSAASRSHYNKVNAPESNSEKDEDNEINSQAIIKTPVYDDDNAATKKSRKSKRKSRKGRKKSYNSSQDYGGSASWHNSNPMYEALEE
ncbi:MAG: hypothetical protein K5838_01900 [Elusimicrobiales bacterium]|nr:hypothetical protein [Elusimicrobiales bacterium]